MPQNVNIELFYTDAFVYVVRKLIFILTFFTILSGTLWACIFITEQFRTWRENPKFITEGNVELSELDYPAVTICSEGSTMYGVAERLGNYLIPETDLPNELLSIRNQFFMCAITKSGKYVIGPQIVTDQELNIPI